MKTHHEIEPVFSTGGQNSYSAPEKGEDFKKYNLQRNIS
jgi:hypothetical protein